MLFEKQPKTGKKAAKKLFTFCKTQVDTKKNFYVATPLLTKNWCFFELAFFKEKHWCWTKNKTKNLEKTKIRKGDLKEKEERKATKMRKDWWTKTLQFIILMLFFSWNKSKEERKRKEETKTQNKKKAKKKDKKEGRKRKRETEKVKVKKGEAQKG